MDCTISTERHLEFGNDISLANSVVRHLEASLSKLGICDETETIQVAVALREALSNAIYRGNLELSSDLRETLDGSYDLLALERANREPYRRRRVRVKIIETRESLTYVVCDDGPGFEPSSIPDPLSEENIEKASGRGLFLIRTFMDEVHYNAIGNELTMVKRRKG
jgi:anti-sigma regulatory factor (Ser/Thr protein kinase)